MPSPSGPLSCVESSSSISWAGSLFYNNYDNAVARITRNVLDAFLVDEPLPTAAPTQ